MIAQYSERPAVKRTTSAITTIPFHLAWHKYKHVPIAIQLFQESKSSCDWWINHDEFMLPWKVLFVLVRWSSNLYLANKALIDLKLLTWDEGHLQSSDALCFNNDLATGTWDFTDQNGFKNFRRTSRMVQISKSLEHSKTRPTWQTAKQQTSKVITGASSVMSFSSASFCDSAWNGTISSHGARMPETGGEFLSEAHAVASQSSHIANGSLDALAFTMMKSYQVGSMILNVTMHAQQSLSLSLCTEELPTALEIKLSPQRKLPNNRPGFMWPWSASNIQLLA